MTRVFADTYYFLALLNANDPGHVCAVAAARSLRGELVSTAGVLTEFADAMSDPRNRAEFIATLADLRNDPQVTIFPPDPKVFEEGLDLFANRSDKEWSLTDCISFVVMTKEGITDALTGAATLSKRGLLPC